MKNWTIIEREKYMNLTPAQLIKVSHLRKQYMAALEKWSQSPYDFSVMVQTLSVIGMVKLGCLDLWRDAAKQKGIHIEDFDQGHRLFSIWKVQHSEAKLMRLYNKIESTVCNKQFMQAKTKLMAHQAHISDINVNIALLNQGHTMSLLYANALEPILNYVISFNYLTPLVIDNITDDAALKEYKELFDQSIYESSRYHHCVLLSQVI